MHFDFLFSLNIARERAAGLGKISGASIEPDGERQKLKAES
jgi:hypothetical protein